MIIAVEWNFLAYDRVPLHLEFRSKIVVNNRVDVNYQL